VLRHTIVWQGVETIPTLSEIDVPANFANHLAFRNLSRKNRIAADQRLEATLILRRADEAGFASHIAQVHKGTASPLDRDQFVERFGASAADISAVEEFAKRFHLTVVERSPERRSVIVSGHSSAFEKAFGIELYHYVHDMGTFRGADQEVPVPSELSTQMIAVLGLDNRPRAMPHFRPASSAALSYTPLQVAARYGFPAGDGNGQCIGIIELGGGYAPADLDAFFKGLGLATPSVTAVSVDNASNQPTGSADGPDGEVMLDIEVAGAIAPKARIAVYFAPNTDAGFTDAISQAVHDSTEKPSVISISWGGPESSWTSSAIKAMDAALADAAALGITVCIASGDNGASDGASDGADHVDFPASSPHALGCGGTSLKASSESVWNDGANGGAGGGGVSTVFALPDFQQGLSIEANGAAPQKLAMRGVPDVAGDADPETGYQVRVDGSNSVIGGTSAVAPLWAGLIARLNASAGQSLGFLVPKLYAEPSLCTDITTGNNNGYQASVGWDACTGLGSPNGAALAKLKPGKITTNPAI
jgi:kumamolisin